MRENDEITGLFRSRLAGAEMTVREGFWKMWRLLLQAGRRRHFFLRNIIG